MLIERVLSLDTLAHRVDQSYEEIYIDTRRSDPHATPAFVQTGNTGTIYLALFNDRVRRVRPSAHEIMDSSRHRSRTEKNGNFIYISRRGQPQEGYYNTSGISLS